MDPFLNQYLFRFNTVTVLAISLYSEVSDNIEL